MKKVAFVYTSMGGLVETTRKLAAERLPGVETLHIADSGLVADIIRSGEITPAVRRRLMYQFESAAAAGADAIVCACSSVGEIAEMADTLLDVPVIRIDQAMIDEAVATYDRIGVLASVESTIGPTTACIRRAARRAGRDVTIAAKVAQGAYQAQAQGNREEHDRLLMACAREMNEGIDVLLLAQGSMARMEQPLADALGKPVLSSPERCMRALATLIG
ncbi:MAG TPA: aspartate/glutamate racemase family protein [Candidatus Limiplasma pullicola]|nr:aspartate/glutamate racemase family protein [Candidatus Limiplasma pullicola]